MKYFTSNYLHKCQKPWSSNWTRNRHRRQVKLFFNAIKTLQEAILSRRLKTWILWQQKALHIHKHPQSDIICDCQMITLHERKLLCIWKSAPTTTTNIEWGTLVKLLHSIWYLVSYSIVCYYGNFSDVTLHE